MECYCSSKNIYRNQQSQSISINNKTLSAKRSLNTVITDNPLKQSILQSSSIYMPPYIQKISYHEIRENPLWFYQQFMALNRPCIITEALQGIKQIESWKSPSEFLQDMNKYKIDNISTSITPDGFADSIKNQYFVEPEEIRTNFKDICNWGDNQKSSIKSEWIPYVQHQNSNLTQEMNSLYQNIDHECRNFLSHNFFKDKAPDAQNLWMGYKNSVSSIHKDPYQNFYSVLVGQKHFTLLPPISIIYLPEEEYTNSKWTLKDNSLSLDINEGVKTKWIACNPDLAGDWQKFPQLNKLKQFNYHVIVQAGQMLYLPALWYHQVSQFHQKQPYVIAMNYWFDMQFNQNYTLYEAARVISGYN